MTDLPQQHQGREVVAEDVMQAMDRIKAFSLTALMGLTSPQRQGYLMFAIAVDVLVTLSNCPTAAYKDIEESFAHIRATDAAYESAVDKLNQFFKECDACGNLSLKSPTKPGSPN